MERLGRWTFNILAALAFLTALGCVAAWVRSTHFEDHIDLLRHRSNGYNLDTVLSYRGKVVVFHNVTRFEGREAERRWKLQVQDEANADLRNEGFTHRAKRLQPTRSGTSRPQSLLQRIGFEATWETRVESDPEAGTSISFTYHEYSAPYWVLVVCANAAACG